jgi:hypothetical protein
MCRIEFYHRESKESSRDLMAFGIVQGYVGEPGISDEKMVDMRQHVGKQLGVKIRRIHSAEEVREYINSFPSSDLQGLLNAALPDCVHVLGGERVMIGIESIKGMPYLQTRRH